jgi:hypothetical protein
MEIGIAACRAVTEPVPLRLRPAFLQPFPKGMKHGMSNHCGNHGDGEIRDRKNIAEGEGQSFPVSIGRGEFSHQKI